MRMLILQALAYQELGQTTEAIGAIRRALRLAEPEGYISMFLELGLPMVSLLQSLQEDKGALSEVSLPFVQTLLHELGITPETQPAPAAGMACDAAPQLAQEPLTERELEILRLLAIGLSNQDIARQLVVEVSTVKWHIRHIYAKLQVSNRTQALLQAQARGLLT